MKFKLFARLKKKAGIGKQKPGDRRNPSMIINELSSKGLPEAEIIRTLKDEGYSFKEIDDALNDSVRSEVTGTPHMTYAGYNEQGTAPQAEMGEQQYQDTGKEEDYPQDNYNPPNEFMDQSNMAAQQPSMNLMNEGFEQPGVGGAPTEEEINPEDNYRNNIYEIVESVVDERVNSVRGEIKEIDEQIKGIQKILSEFKSEVQEEQDSRRKELGSTHESIKDNTAKIIDLEPRVLGLERAFKDIVPNLVDSVREIKEYVAGHVGTPEKDEMHNSNIFEEHEGKVHETQNKKKKDNTKDDELSIFDESDEDERI